MPIICDIYLAARKDKVLIPQQERLADIAEIIVRSLAKLGIIALVDEATGYQEIREKKALEKLVNLFLNQEYAAWSKRFPTEFYKELFRLKGWLWDPSSTKCPKLVGKITNDIVYGRLAPGVLAELQKINPKDSKGNRVVKHHQFLTDNKGHTALDRHIHTVIAFMKTASSYEQFHSMMNTALPIQKASNIKMGEYIED